MSHQEPADDLGEILKDADKVFHFIAKHGRKHFTKSDTQFAHEGMKRILDIFESAIIREAYGRPLEPGSEL